jgi:hypothetical protein
MIGLVQPPVGAVRRRRGGFVRVCDGLCVWYTEDDPDRRAALAQGGYRLSEKIMPKSGKQG